MAWGMGTKDSKIGYVKHLLRSGYYQKEDFVAAIHNGFVGKMGAK